MALSLLDKGSPSSAYGDVQIEEFWHEDNRGS